jgi:hypothetical protein
VYFITGAILVEIGCSAQKTKFYLALFCLHTILIKDFCKKLKNVNFLTVGPILLKIAPIKEDTMLRLSVKELH